MLQPLRALPKRLFLPALLVVFASLVLSCGGTDASKNAGRQPTTASMVRSASALSDSQPPPPALAAPAPAVKPSIQPVPWSAAPLARPGTPPAPEISALAAVVVDESSGAVLFGKDEHLALPPASLTKIATLILALEHGGLDDIVTSDVDYTTMRGSTVMGLLPGDRFTLRDLLYGLMLPSGNDAALVIGRYVAGSDEAFVARMNALLARLGLSDSHFSNPHGLGGVNHVVSAYDLAMLARYGMSLPGFYDIVNTRHYTARGLDHTIELWNINNFLNYKDADGIKTGYTRGAGSTLAASIYRNGHRIFAVMLNDGARDSDASRLLNWAFTNYTWPAP